MSADDRLDDPQQLSPGVGRCSRQTLMDEVRIDSVNKVVNVDQYWLEKAEFARNLLCSRTLFSLNQAYHSLVAFLKT